MIKIYVFAVTAILLASCVEVYYLGSSYPPTEKVDIYVDASAIKKPYTVMGKGYPDVHPHSDVNVEVMQDLAVKRAKQKGADAILFQEYYLGQDGLSVNSVTRSDSVNKGVVIQTSTTASPVITKKREILFLKYND